MKSTFLGTEGEDSDDLSSSVNQYWLYTRSHPYNGRQIKINDIKSLSSSFMKTKETIFLVHGWLGYYTDDLNINITRALLQNRDVNVICVDWNSYSKLDYLTAVNHVAQVGSDLGDFINWLTSLGFSYEKMHIAGHSLGAHVAGYAGRRTNGRIRRITGMDPAGPAWSNRKMLTPNDAQYVECIHTSAKWLGTDKLCGDADFYPNGGMFMPGCGFDMGCSHGKAFYYFSASVVHPRKFVGYKCSSVDQAMECDCRGEQAMMGNSDLDKIVSGIYCLKTTDNYPFYK